MGRRLASEDPGTAPVWVEIAVTACVLAVCLVPCVTAVSFGRRAAAGGDRRGRWPAAIGFLAGLSFVVLTLVTEIGDVVRR